MAKKADRYLAAEVDSLREEFLNSTVKGTGYERVLAEVVRGVLPQTWRVGWGEIVDPDRRQSGQTDLVIALPSQPSLLHRDDGNWLFLSPSVVAIGEAKMHLTAERWRELLDGPARDWAALDRAAMHLMGVGPGGADNDATWGARLPVFVFAHEGPTLATIEGELKGLPAPLIDAVFIRDRGVLLRSPGPDASFPWAMPGTQQAPPAGEWVRFDDLNEDVVETFLLWLTVLPVWMPFEQRPLRQFIF
jgi:hypothetical protein